MLPSLIIHFSVPSLKNYKQLKIECQFSKMLKI